jgi:predicted dehydrogenase
VFVGDERSHGAVETTAYRFDPVNQYTLQVERFSRYLRGEPVPSWPIDDALLTLRVIEALFASTKRGHWQAVAG